LKERIFLSILKGEERVKEMVLQWHPAYQAAMQVELEEEMEFLQFEVEHNLSKKPLQIDTLVIKKQRSYQVKKSIGKLFRGHNIIEYKSPEDYVSINDFYKVMGYACLYQAETEKVMAIPPEEITVTLACSCYPRKLIQYLENHYPISTEPGGQGIYYIKGMIFPVQIIVIPRLAKEEYTWLSRLGKNLSLKEDIEPLAKIFEKKKQEPLYEAIMDLIIRANWEKYKEGRAMCDALRELFADELEQKERDGLEKGAFLKLVSLVRKKVQKGIPVTVIADVLEENQEQIGRICQCILDHPEKTDEDVCKILSGE